MYNPSFCNFPFIQPPSTIDNHKYINYSEGLYSDKKHYPKLVSTKLSACIFRRDTLLESKVNPRSYIGSMWSHVPYIFSSLLTDSSFLIFPRPVMKSANDCMNIRYDPYVLGNLYSIIKSVYDLYDLRDEFKASGLKSTDRRINDLYFYLQYKKSYMSFDDVSLNSLKKRLFSFTNLAYYLFSFVRGS